MLLIVLTLPLLVAADEMPSSSSEVSSSSTASTLVVFPTPINSNQTNPSSMMPEAKRAPEPQWSPSPPDLTPMMMHHQPTMPPPPPPYMAAVVHSPPQQPQQPPQQQQPFVPSNYYLPGGPADEFPGGNQFGPPLSSSSNEYRSEHYSSYPSYEQPSFPMTQNPQVDASLIPSAKHFVLVSFIGLLLLFAIIQNSIATAKRKDALVEVLSNRKKRDLVTLTNLERMTPEMESALKEDARIRCIQRILCYENRKLHEDLGIFGKLLAKYLTRNVQSSLRDLSPGWDRFVEDAANAGLRGDDCDVLYRDCASEMSAESEIIDEDEE